MVSPCMAFKRSAVRSRLSPIYESMPQWSDFGTINRASDSEDIEIDDSIKVIFENYNLKVVASQDIEDLRLFDISGMMLCAVQPGTCEAVIDTHAYSNNIYLLQITSVDGKQTVLKVARIIR